MKDSGSSFSRAELLSRDIRRYLAYWLERDGFTKNMAPATISDAARRAALSIRGVDRDPAILLHGIMPRSGTVYTGQLLRLHPDLHGYPYELWETPALVLSPSVAQLGRKFLLEYKPNIGKFDENDILPLLGAALLAYFYEDLPPTGRMLLKIPSVQYITHFYSMFPHENLLLLVRDGRDLVHSTLRTWPWLNFPQVCLRWRRSAQAVLSAVQQFEQEQRGGYLLIRFEDVIADPSSFISSVCSAFSLDRGKYPEDRIEEIKVIGSSTLAERGKGVSWKAKPRPEGFRPTQHWAKWSAARKIIFKLLAGRPLIELEYCEDLTW